MARSIRSGAAIVLALTLLAPAQALGQDVAPTEPAHPAHVHAGTCPAPLDIVAPLGDVAADLPVDGEPSTGDIPLGTDTTTPVLGSTTTLELDVRSLLDDRHAVVVHASADDLGTLLVCGDIGGRLAGDELTFALLPVDGSGYAGIGVLRSQDDVVTLTVRMARMADGGAQTPAPTTAPAPTTTPAPAAQAMELAHELWWAGLGVQVTGAALDPATGTLTVDTVLSNEGDAQRPLGTIANQVFAVIDGTPEILRTDAPAIAGGTSTPVTFRLTGVDPELDLASVVFQLGRADQRPASVALAPGATVTSEFPRDAVVNGQVRLRGTGRFVLIDGRVVPAGCTGRSTDLGFEAIGPDEESIVLTVREVGQRRLGAIASATITGPNGLTYVANTGVTLLTQGQTNNGRRWCFQVAAPAQGEYRVTFETSEVRGSRTIRIP